jgi:endo-1,4-beta-xylanase
MAGLAVAVHAQTTLKDAYKNIFRIGAAINQTQFNEQDARGGPIISAQFNTISPENVLKWESVHPRLDGYNFEQADRYVAFGEKNHMFIVGHCLVWHSQVPQWVFQDDKGAPLDRDGLLKRMREHIMTVAGRYKGRIHSWDVVNEALNDDGTLRQSPWMRIIGEDYIAKAFDYAHEADPQAELNYNDYSLENEAKRKGAVELIKKLKDRGARPPPTLTPPVCRTPSSRRWRSVTPPCSACISNIATPSRGSLSGASRMAIPGRTTFRSGAERTIRCCSTARANPCRPSTP